MSSENPLDALVKADQQELQRILGILSETVEFTPEALKKLTALRMDLLHQVGEHLRRDIGPNLKAPPITKAEMQESFAAILPSDIAENFLEHADKNE